MSGWEGSTRKDRLPSDWISYRRPTVLARDHGICHVCGRPGADEVDHLNQGDDHDLTNLAAVHGPRTGLRCHSAKSAAEGGRAAAARRPTTRRPEEPHPGALHPNQAGH